MFADLDLHKSNSHDLEILQQEILCVDVPVYGQCHGCSVDWDAAHVEPQWVRSQWLPVAGILIYTASNDADGGLGGLARMGKTDAMEPLPGNALRSALWCSSDPICMASEGQGYGATNLAACHACALVPETRCERGNALLDRAAVVVRQAGRSSGSSRIFRTPLVFSENMGPCVAR